MPDPRKARAADAGALTAGRALARLGPAALLVLLAGCSAAPHVEVTAARATGATRAAPYTSGWILLNDDPASVARTLEAAESYGVTYIQLSHDLLMNIDEVLPASAAPKVERLNAIIEAAHARDMKVHAWAHELSGIRGASVCYDPDAKVWKRRADAYRRGLALLPGLDGIVLMFGSAPTPPWDTACLCGWCLVNFPAGYPMSSPPQAERLRTVISKLAEVIVDELGRELVVRTFVHRPEELDWHSEALESLAHLGLRGMYKAEVQDWHPYHPYGADAVMHGAFVEMDAAGEYWGLSILPLAAPEYFAWRLDRMFEHQGAGAVVRVERAQHIALGTPNEVNLFAISARLADPDVPMDVVWSRWIESFYGVGPATPARQTLERILRDAFAIRLKSHYVLGVWALEKNSDLPDSAKMDELDRRGRLHEWDPEWAPVWNAVKNPTRETVVQIWQEASEAVALADASLAASESLAASLTAAKYADLRRRLQHQWHAARAWRDVKLFLWARKVGGAEMRAWARWAWNDLAAVRKAMEADGLGDVAIAGPARIAAFLRSTARLVPTAAPSPPDVFLFGPVRASAAADGEAVLSFKVSDAADVTVEFGTDPPELDDVAPAGMVVPEETKQVRLSGLAPRERYVARLVAEVDGKTYRSGYHWFFTD